MALHPISRVELENLRRSLAASGSLPREEIARLIAEADRMVVERQRIAKLLESLRGPWPAVRHSLNGLQRVLLISDTGPRASEH